MRGVLLAGSRNEWLRNQASRRTFVRRAVSRFMPGETLDDALSASHGLARDAMGVILTHLGENVTERAEADAVAVHYLEVIERIRSAGLDGEVAIKLTQLGYDLSPDLAFGHRRRSPALPRVSRAASGSTWRAARTPSARSTYTGGSARVHANVGVALQAYLRRTRADLEVAARLWARDPAGQGRVREPESDRVPDRAEVDASFLDARRAPARPRRRARGAGSSAGRTTRG